MRRLSTVEGMLLTAVGLWALNFTLTRYILTHGFKPLAYGTVRYGLAAIVFAGITFALERSFRVAGRDRRLVILAIVALWVNQIAFVYSLRTTSASVIALVNASAPAFAAVLGVVLGTERLSRRFWLGALVSFAGVSLVALATAGGKVEGDLVGILLGVVTALTWAIYAVVATPLMRSYSPVRISALVLAGAWALIALVGISQTSSQRWDLGWSVWGVLVLATAGPLLITNILWFRSLDRIGPARATLALNLQPFVAAVFAVLLLDERLTTLQIAGGVLIAAGLAVARRRARAPRQ